jgi:hypothetical protein
MTCREHGSTRSPKISERRPPQTGPRRRLPKAAKGLSQPRCNGRPAGEIEARLHPNDTQRSALEGLQRASARTVDILNYECQSDDAITPLERLFAVDQRLNDMQLAVNRVSAALEDFYATLSDEQKAQFEAIGPGRSAAPLRQSSAAPIHVRHYHTHAGINGLIRHFMSMARW